MQPTSSFPVILLMGPPHSGKSVLAYWLSAQLKQHRAAHFLLRAAPDGEGNWFHEGAPSVVLPLRQRHKAPFPPTLVRAMLHIVQHRHLPLLVDMGGKPRGEQRRLLALGTHGILLYRCEEERIQWHRWLREEHSSLKLIAELRSDLYATEQLEAKHPHLRGVIAGLQRHQPYHPGPVGQALLNALVALLPNEDEVAAYHATTRPPQTAFLYEDDWARRLGKPLPPYWAPQDLPRVLAQIPRQGSALYGRGPVWLAAAVAAHLHPQPLWIFDAHFGWLSLPPVVPGPCPPWRLTWDPEDHQADRLLIALDEPFVSWGALPWVGPRHGKRGVILDGKLPRWAFAAWVRHLSPVRPWVAIADPRLKAAVVVASQDPAVPVGATVAQG